MTPREKYGALFEMHTSMLTPRGEHQSHPHIQVAVGIGPSEDKPATLEQAWTIVRELAAWIVIAEFPADALFTVVVGWSRHVRPGRGQIFKVWGDRNRMAEIAAYKKYRDYRPLGSWHVPALRWEQDVWGELSEAEVRTRIQRTAEIHKDAL